MATLLTALERPQLEDGASRTGSTSDLSEAFLKEAVPPPLAMSIESNICPVPTLLEQFPLPSTRHCVILAETDTTTEYPREELEELSHHVSETVRDLAASGHLSFVQCCLPSEQHQLTEEAAVATSSFTIPLAAAGKYVSAAADGAIRDAVSEAHAFTAGPRSATPHCTKTTLASGSVRPRPPLTGHRMTLRPRKVSLPTAPTATVEEGAIRCSPSLPPQRSGERSDGQDGATVAIPPAVSCGSSPTKKKKLLSQRNGDTAERELALPTQDASTDCLEKLLATEPCDLDGPALWKNAVALSKQKVSFTADQVVAYLGSLLTYESPSVTDGSYTAICGGMVALACLSHSQFPIAACAAGSVAPLVDAIISRFALLTRILCQAFSALHTAAAGKGESIIPHSFNAGITLHKYTIHIFELLRFALRSLERMVGCSVAQLISDSNLQRLEDLCYRLLFVSPNRLDKPLFRTYASYVMDAGVRLYRAVWNHLEDQRDAMRQEFFARIIATDDALIERCYDVSEAASEPGSKIMPLTAALLSAAQSCPYLKPCSTELRPNSDRLFASKHWLVEQCSAWVDTMMREMCLRSAAVSGATAVGNRRIEQTVRKEDTDARLRLVRLILEDVAGLVGLPQWVGADAFARSSILVLLMVAEVLGMLNRHGGSNNSDFLGAPYAELYNDASFTTSTAYLQSASAQLLREISPCRQHNFREVWQQTLQLPLKEGGEESASLVTELEGCLLAVQRKSAKDWVTTGEEPWADLHCRGANVSYWRWLEELDEPQRGCGPLPQPLGPCTGGSMSSSNIKTEDFNLEVSNRQMRSMAILISAQRERGVLHDSMRRRLVSLLLSVLQPSSSASGSGDGSSEYSMVGSAILEGVKKTLAHVADLVQRYPQLVEVVWPMVRRHIQHGSAKVRESSIPLLNTLLTVSLGTAPTRETQLDVATNVVSSLLHLLDDESVLVVTKTIAVLEGLLTHVTLSSALRQHGEGHISFIENKLLSKVTPGMGGKQTHDVARLFMRRWVHTLEEEEAVAMGTGAQTSLVREVTRLVELHAGSFPFEIVETHPVLQLLRQVWEIAEGDTAPTRASKNKVADGNQTAQVHLKHRFASLARSLWSRFQSPVSREDSIICLCSLHMLSMVSTEIVEPLIERLMHLLTYPVEPGAPHYGDAELTGAALLHTCHTVQQIISGSGGKPAVSMDGLAAALTHVLSRYTGPYQQRVISASCGALVSMITCSPENTHTEAYSEVYLRHCYSLMNTYFARLKGLVPGLATQPASLPYAQRLLFLLSEFLRQYRGWKDTPRMVKIGADVTGDVPNVLAAGDGICENIFKLIEEMKQRMPLHRHPQLHLMVLRVIGSLCMLDPNTYLYRYEKDLADSIACTHPTSMAHVQCLTLIRDFLVEEDSRVEKASLSPLPARAPRKRARQFSIAPSAKPTEGISPSRSDVWMEVEDENSGMSTWLMSQFIAPITALVSDPLSQVRHLCLQILQLTARGGLLPPHRYAAVLMLLATDPAGALRRGALQSLNEHRETWRDDVVLTAALRCASDTLDYHYAVCAQAAEDNVLSAAYRVEGGVPVSVWAPIYKMLPRKSQSTFLEHLLRHFYAGDKVSRWCASHPCEGWARATDERVANPFVHCNPLTYMGHLALGLALLPIGAAVSDAQRCAKECLQGMDLEGQSAADVVRATSEREEGLPRHTLSPSSLYKAIGVLFLSFITKFMRAEVDDAQRKGSSTRRCRRSAGGAAVRKTTAFVEKVCRYVQRLHPLIMAYATDEITEKSGDVSRSLSFLKTEIEAVVDSLEHLTHRQTAQKRPRRSPSTMDDDSSSCSSESSESESGMSGEGNEKSWGL
eukprot:gene4323-3137_t